MLDEWPEATNQFFLAAGLFPPHPRARPVVGDRGSRRHYLLHDRDARFCQSFRELIKTGNVNPLRLPARSPNLNSYAERWVRSVKEECLSKLILFGESSLQRALQQYMEHYQEERNHQGKA